MKSIMRLYFLAAFLFICTVGFQCTKEADNIPESGSGCLKGKLVISGLCKNLVVQIIGGSYEASRVEAKWTNPANNTEYINVFDVANFDSFPGSIKEGDEFNFYFIPTSPVESVRCMAYVPVPSVNNHIMVTSSCTTN